MSYGILYKIQFKNREQVDCEVQLLQKDAADDITYLTGADNPFVLSSSAQDNQIPYGIKATEANTQFYSQNGVSLDTFYSEDDTFWRLDFYYAGVKKWTGYLQLDSCSESITDIDHIITLNANDGLGRLQSQYLLGDDGKPLNVQLTLLQLFSRTLPLVGLVLSNKVWLNIFENSTEDRDDDGKLTLLPQTALPTSYFINSDGTGQTVYDILNNVLLALRSMLTQADGYWQIIRWGDVRLFADGTMPGTLYDEVWGTASEIFFDDSIDIGAYSAGYAVHPINENQLQTILRPYKFSLETFSYEQPPLIIQASLQIPADAIPFSTSTVAGIRTDKYSIADYFPDWIQRNGDTSYLTVVTDTNVTPEQETDRYIHKPSDFDTHSGVQFNPLNVSQNDSIDLSLNFRTHHSDGYFWVRFILITEDGDYYSLNQNILSSVAAEWEGPFSANDWFSDPTGVAANKSGEAESWFPYNLLSNTETTTPFLIPASGVLLIEVDGNSNTLGSGFGTYATDWKDLNLTLNQFINNSTQIIGQTHNNSQTPDIRNNEQFDVSLDDSPRNTIKGTLFTDALTNFDFTDTDTGEETDIGNIYFTRTSSWHRQGVTEARRLGDLNTFNDLFIQRVVRMVVQGDFFGLNGINLLRVINLVLLERFSKRFIFGAASFNYMTCVWTASLYELYDTGEVDGDLDNTYLFTYLYDTQR
jgi:hypothetical protein